MSSHFFGLTISCFFVVIFYIFEAYRSILATFRLYNPFLFLFFFYFLLSQTNIEDYISGHHVGLTFSNYHIFLQEMTGVKTLYTLIVTMCLIYSAKVQLNDTRLIYEPLIGLTVIGSEDSFENDFSSHFLGLTIYISSLRFFFNFLVTQLMLQSIIATFRLHNPFLSLSLF